MIFVDPPVSIAIVAEYGLRFSLAAPDSRSFQNTWPSRHTNLGLAIAPLLTVEHGQVVEALGHVGVFRTQPLLPDRQGPLVERLGLAWVVPLAADENL